MCHDPLSGTQFRGGSRLSRALAEAHLRDGTTGIVSPYRAEAEAVGEGLRDRGVRASVAVGTVHAFQGREFPTVVFDLVEDGTSWMSRAKLDGETPFERDGVAVFGVGITRARDRLYLLSALSAVRAAGTGPLSALRSLLDRGEVTVWSAAALLGMCEPPAAEVDDSFQQVAEVLQQLVTVTEVHDERTFVPELERHLNAARSRVWMWSPWLANRAKVIVPIIEALIARGVDVRVFVRTDQDHLMRTANSRLHLAALRATGATVIRSEWEHRKIVVIDERLTLLGSLNPMSAVPGRTREVMLTMEGAEFARRMLGGLRAEELGVPRPCTMCSKAMDVRRRAGKEASEVYWHCRDCGVRVPAQRPSSDRVVRRGSVE